MFAEDCFISSVQIVIDEVKQRLDLDVKPSYVLEQMKLLGLKYSKVKHISMQGNSERSLVLRQRWAITFLGQDFRKNIINVDETWLGMTDFRRMHWKPSKSNSSIRAKSLVPRISMITGVDKLGNVYLSLTQSNSNKSMMGLFMEQLVLKLDKANPHWRNGTVIQWDGAAYHRAKGTLEMLQRLRVPIMMLGPYSYDVAPAELFFAAFKKADVNPNHIPLGKGHFK